MKKFLSVLFISTIVLLAACGTAEEDASQGDTSEEEETGESVNGEDTLWQDVQEAGKLVVGTSGTYAPVTYHDENNELTGFDVEMMREIGERLGVEVEFSTMDFDGILPALRNGQIDIASNDFAITEEREEIFTFTDPYKFSYGSVIVRSDDMGHFESAYDLEGVPVALGSLTSNYAIFAENIGAEGTAYDGGVDAILRDIINENQDAYLNDVLVLHRTLEGFDDDSLAVAEQVKFHATESAFPMLKGNNSLKEVIDEVLQEMKEDGTIAELSQEFFGADASEPVDQDEVVSLEGN
ncbi:transporter substrate-binding domain-containing protein [Alkalibacillus haloalkaliphilus]|uniref:transporter substrate-binding domain-containing protein n=1 Tax=Alkalibacillus haloalkaliphilus TaxID=94136 RepID=UPI002935B4BC|nr:transporter substrate-binding domain-containing protein [Alkalibacillus haloalkaliphilus]MDV2581742.1 transporter substrate-binding domain-containing protein [Alkalibacillus haloalkaliphilus]